MTDLELAKFCVEGQAGSLAFARRVQIPMKDESLVVFAKAVFAATTLGASIEQIELLTRKGLSDE